MSACRGCSGRVTPLDVDCRECPAKAGTQCWSERTGKNRPAHRLRKTPDLCPACRSAGVEAPTLDAVG